MILRGGNTLYGNDRKKVKDAQFEAFYRACKAVKMPVGVYYYSCATNRQEGIAEAEFLYQQCLKDKQFEYPIYIDVENDRWQRRDKKGVTDAIIGFCSYLESKGFYVGVYASVSWFNTYIETDRLRNYTKWVARWSPIKPSFRFSGFDMWQNSDNGIIGEYIVDTDIAYKDFPTIMRTVGKNGYKTIFQIAQEVLKGEWGVGADRQHRLESAGYDYREIQNKVNEILSK